MDVEIRTFQLELEFKEKEKQRLKYKLLLKKLELGQLRFGLPGSNINACFDVTKHIRSIPPFREQDVDFFICILKRWWRTLSGQKSIGHCCCKVF